MTQMRRVVTGHDPEGKAKVLIDETIDVVERAPGGRIGAKVFWTTESFPVSNDGDDDTAQREVATALPNGSIFRVVDFMPGNPPRRHRTDTIDYAIVLSGEIDMELDGDEVVHIKAGDVLVQRGTIHNWVNRGSETCRICFILVDAKPVEANGKVLHAEG